MSSPRLLLLAAALTCAACTPDAAPPQAAAPAAPLPSSQHAPGTTLHYTRSNQDGSLSERVLVHIVSDTELAVAKMVDRCTDAALVTATFDQATGEVSRLIGGRLGQNGAQNPQAWLDLEPTARRLDVRLGDPASAPAEVHNAPPAPWRMYDFDFAEFALFAPRGEDGPKDFSYGLAMAWPDGTTPVVRILGDADAAFVAAEQRDARAVNRYRLSGPAYTDGQTDIGGDLILDAEYGHVVEARLARPNHTGYTDFLLKLDRITPDEASWQSELAGHWQDC